MDPSPRSSNHAHVILWAMPRSTSTAITKCLSAIPGNEVWYEPYAFGNYAQTIIRTDEKKCLPMEYEGNEELYERGAHLLGVLAHSAVIPDRLSFAWIKRSLENTASKFVFVKDIGIAMDSDENRRYLPQGYRHTFIIRHPTLVFTSYRKAMYKQLLEAGVLSGDMKDEKTFDVEKADRIMSTGRMFLSCYDLWRHVRDTLDGDPIVIDSSDLLSQPAEILKLYCEAVGFPFSDSLLQWDAAIDVMATWTASCPNHYRVAENFMYTSAHSSSFTSPRAAIPPEELTDDVRRLSEAAMPFYQEMYENRLKYVTSI